jgi:hypothetical protein
MANEMQAIETITITSNTSSIIFTSIPQTFTDLKILVSARSSISGTESQYRIIFNSDTSQTYYRRELAFNGTTSNTFGESTSQGFNYVYMPSASSLANTFSINKIEIPNYTKSNKKIFKVDSCMESDIVATALQLQSGLWNGTAAITSIILQEMNSGNFVPYTTATLYGIKTGAESQTPKATGGIVTSDASYWYHTFTYSDTFTPTQNLTADYLVVAGGGGGGSNRGGGGGGGGLRCTVGSTGGGGSLESALALTSGTGYTVTVGAGGAGSSGTGLRGSTGSNSIFSTITSNGGGGGGSYSTNNIVGSDGGSGGGGGHISPRTGGSGTTNQGYAGGNGESNSYGAGGGGGAGAVGQNAGVTSTGQGGDGGNGVATAISGTSTYYAGGGGGGSLYPSGGVVFSIGGLGGGGNGGVGNASVNRPPTTGSVNTGGGGGGNGEGGGVDNPTDSGKSGGSGIVIIRYAK